MSNHRRTQAQIQKETQLDFDLRNYSLEDLYGLFKLDPNEPLNQFTLKKAKRILVYTHPDKSGLPPHFFNFFSKAYGMLEEMEQITNRIKTKPGNSQHTYVDDINTYNNEIHNTIKEAHTTTNNENKRTTIMKEFNTRFEEINRDLLPQNDNKGYAEWLKHENPEENVQNHKELYAKRKQELRDQYALTAHKIENPNFYSSSGSSLLDQQQNYSSGLFDSMQYSDLKQSYTETIIPVSEEDYKAMPSYSSIEDYKRVRDRPMDTSIYRDHNNMIKAREEEDRKMNDYRAFELAKQLERSGERNKAFESQFYKILN
jgi:hypothetical protein